jgi:hypothetical protein
VRRTIIEEKISIFSIIFGGSFLRRNSLDFAGMNAWNASAINEL